MGGPSRWLKQRQVDRLVSKIDRAAANEGGMNPSESRFTRHCERESIPWLRGGWPDFMCEIEGAPAAVEVKAGWDTVRPAQAKMHRALEKAGIPVYVWNPKLPGRLIPATKYSPEYVERTLRGKTEPESIETRNVSNGCRKMPKRSKRPPVSIMDRLDMWAKAEEKAESTAVGVTHPASKDGRHGE